MHRHVVGYLVLSYAPMLISSLMERVFIVPLLNHPVWRLVFLTLLIWNGLGLYLLTRTKKAWLRAIAYLVFALPLSIMIFLGPTSELPMEALGPVINGR